NCCGLVRRSCSDRQARMSKTSGASPRLTTRYSAGCTILHTILKVFQSFPVAERSVRSFRNLWALPLHHHRQVLQLILEDWQGTTGHFDPACCIERCRGRNSIPTAHQKHPKEFCSLVGIDHTTLKQVASQGCQLRHRESVLIIVHRLEVRH